MSPEERRTSIEARGPWICFHCGETCETVDQARDHFGTDEFEECACIERLTETDKAIVEDRREWKRRALRAEEEVEQAQYETHLLRFDLGNQFKGAKSINDAWFQYETMEGRALAAEAALAAAPSWLVRFLRARAEKAGGQA